MKGSKVTSYKRALVGKLPPKNDSSHENIVATRIKPQIPQKNGSDHEKIAATGLGTTATIKK